MKKSIVLLLVIQFCMSSCSFKNKDKLIQRQATTKNIFNSSRLEVEELLDVRLRDHYSSYFEGNKYLGTSGSCYNCLFLFKNNELVNILNYSDVMEVWNQELDLDKDKMPYLDNLDSIQSKINQLPTYFPVTKEADSLSAEDVITFLGDGTAAALMLTLGSPLIPAIIVGSQIDALTKVEEAEIFEDKEVNLDEVDWDAEIIGQSYETIISKLGDPAAERDYGDGNKMLGFNGNHYWDPDYVGVKNNRAVWIFHYSDKLTDYF